MGLILSLNDLNIPRSPAYTHGIKPPGITTFKIPRRIMCLAIAVMLAVVDTFFTAYFVYSWLAARWLAARKPPLPRIEQPK